MTLWISLSIFHKLALPFTGTVGWAGGIHNKKNYCIVVWLTGTKDRWGILSFDTFVTKIAICFPGFKASNASAIIQITFIHTFKLQNSLNCIICQSCLKLQSLQMFKGFMSHSSSTDWSTESVYVDLDEFFEAAVLHRSKLIKKRLKAVLAIENWVGTACVLEKASRRVSIGGELQGLINEDAWRLQY